MNQWQEELALQSRAVKREKRWQRWQESKEKTTVCTVVEDCIYSLSFLWFMAFMTNVFYWLFTGHSFL